MFLLLKYNQTSPGKLDGFKLKWLKELKVGKV